MSFRVVELRSAEHAKIRAFLSPTYIVPKCGRLTIIQVTETLKELFQERPYRWAVRCAYPWCESKPKFWAICYPYWQGLSDKELIGKLIEEESASEGQ